VKRRPISVDIEDAFVDASPSNGDQASTPPHVFTRINSYQSDTDQHAADSDLEQGKRQSRARTPSQFYRLSVPQSLKLDPPNPSIRNLPPIPQKKDSFSSTGYRPHPAYPAEDWIERTPSPVKSIRDGISTPPLFRRRGFTAMSLINVVASAWKRRVSNSEHSSDTESRAASRGRDVS
jgi:hypothetical protein